MEKSCELCIQRKVKCDRAKPSCGWCKNNNRECIYTERRRPGIYNTEIQSKINKMEARIQNLARRIDMHISNDCLISKKGAAQNPEPLSPYMSDILSPSAGESHHKYDAIFQGAGSEFLDLTAVPDQITTGNATGSYYEVCTPDSHQISTLDLHRAGLPPHHLTIHFVELFIKHVLSWAPILSCDILTTFLSGQYSSLSEGDYILLHAIVVTSLRFSKDASLTYELRHWYHKVSKQKVQIFALENSNIRAVQALAFVAVDVLGTTDGLAGKKLLALLVRSFLNLETNRKHDILSLDGLVSTHVRDDLLGRAKEQRGQEMKTLFWLIQLLERSFTSTDISSVNLLHLHGIRFCREYEAPTEFFTYKDLGDLEAIPLTHENRSDLEDHCEILDILALVQKLLQKSIETSSLQELQDWTTTYFQLTHKLDSWISELPTGHRSITNLIQTNSPKLVRLLMIHITYALSLIRLHSSVAYSDERSRFLLNSSDAMEKCLGATESLKTIARYAIESGTLDRFGAPLAYALWTAARVLLVHAATTNTEVDGSISLFVAALAEIGQYWNLAEQYASTLKDLLLPQNDNYRSPSLVETRSNPQRMQRDMIDLTTDPARTSHHQTFPVLFSRDLDNMEAFGYTDYPQKISRPGDMTGVESADLLPNYSDPIYIGWRGDF